MFKEIERKFLVDISSLEQIKKSAFESKKIIQGYLSIDPERTVRIRINGNKAFITIKGIGKGIGAERFEWEKEISLEEAERLLDLALDGKIEKVRYYIKVGNHIFEVDEFSGRHQGLVLAEIELSDENESFDKPSWLKEEVTGDKRYYNSYLSQNI